ncbi:hypothetical protein BREVNS_2208 [Brevinematales bacterium NS]|nr:hypothetical protein BREVNS_2208 [Brevinematales bacterium NS]
MKISSILAPIFPKLVTFFSGDLQWEDEEKQKKFLPGR